MLVLGLNSAHDSGVALIDDGKIVGMIQRERLTRIKRNALLTAEFIEECLDWFGVSWLDIDLVAMTTSQSWPTLFVDKKEFCVKLNEDLDFPDRLNAHSARILKHSFNFIKDRNSKHPRSVSLDWCRQYFSKSGSNGEYLLEDPSSFLKSEDDFLPLAEWPSAPNSWLNADLLVRAGNAFNDADRIRLMNYLPAEFTLRGQRRPGLLMPHHLAHAASAYYQSDLESAVISTLDNGDVYVPFRGYVGGMFMVGVGNRIRPVAPSYGYHGHLYQRVSETLGLGHGGGAGKLMGLAPYGEPRYFDHAMVGDAFAVFGDVYCRGRKGGREGVMRLLNRRIGELEKLDLPRLGGPSPYYVAGQFGSADLARPGIDMAATAQMVFEQATLLLLSRFLAAAYTALGVRSLALCLGGGGALNCPVNSAVWRTLPVSDVFVPPACDDSGLPIGAALAVYHDYLDRPRVPQHSKACGSAYLGRQFGEDRIAKALEHTGAELDVEQVGDTAAAAAATLSAGGTVAWYEGRSEVGPRALGHRSILADARGSSTWRRVNEIKKREYWRPFAPAVLAEDYDGWFRGSPSTSPHMLFTATVKGDALPAITHVDGSARVQTVDPSAGRFRDVLSHFKRLTGVPVVLNTSLNGPGEPIVDTPEEAVRFMQTSQIDELYIGSHKVSRKPA